MQEIELPDIADNKQKIPYISISGVFVVVAIFFFLWRPLNPNRITYIPLTQQVQTTVVENIQIPTIVGTATIEILDDKTREPDLTESQDQPKPEDDIVKDEIDDIIEEKNNFIQYTVNRGDTLYGIMMQYGVNRADIYQLTKQFKQLANLRIGQQISWKVDEEGVLQSFTWWTSNNKATIYERVDDRYSERTEIREGIWKPENIQGIISSNFVNDARKSGLTSNEIAMITRALQWQLDFRKLQSGDQFAAIFSREFFDDEHEGSKLIAVRIKNGGRDYYAILADDGLYYDLNGGSLSQSFLRYPLEKQARISSQFNPRRVNPVTKKVTPHNGVDFAVSRGTPVLSSGDGEVIQAIYSGSAGYFITIRHGREYVTKYMHLDKLLVKPGQIVKKGDRIALSGNTGRSTGPHLHYELRINDKPVNPLTANLPISEGLTGKSKTTFIEQIQSITPKLKLLSEG